MSAKRSRTGCLTCRSRKLKCSEEKPVCAQCHKANRECIPSSGVTFRHHQNPSLNNELGDGDLSSFYGYKETFGKGTTWVEVPRELTFVHTSNPYEDESEFEQFGGYGGGSTKYVAETGGTKSSSRDGGTGYEYSQSSYPAYAATQGLEALSAVASRDEYSYAPPSAHGSQTEANASPHQGHIPPMQNIDFILNPSGSGEPVAPTNLDPQLHPETPVRDTAGSKTAHGDVQQQQNHVRTSSYASSHDGRPSLHIQGPDTRRSAAGGIAEPELAFLLRDFSERAGLWMDLFDLGLFFATTVPVQAVRCPLLLYSCVALSAKSLARVDGRKPVMGGQVEPSQRSRMELWPGGPMSKADWYTKAREYYDLAVSLLRQALSGAARPSTGASPTGLPPVSVSNAQGFPLPTPESDELVAATAVLCIYEFLDASGPEWSRHLDGAKSLFDIASDLSFASLPGSPEPAARELTRRISGLARPPVQRALNVNRRAVFWNFARQDMLSAFINNTSTRLDTADLGMWRSAGLKLTEAGYVCPSNPDHPDYAPECAMPEDLISNALIWLLSKLINFIAAGDDVPQTLSSPLGLGVRQRELLEYWEGLDRQLTVWYDGLPNSFRATAVYSSDSDLLGVPEKWFPRPMCASTMQSYHFARIQLLHNKPHETTGLPTPSPSVSAATTLPLPASVGLAARNASYAAILQQSRAHAREIVAIGLGRADEGARIHSVQPLWTAGLVLGNAGVEVKPETEMWRRTIVRLLRGIERDIGWASEYRVRSLLGCWGLEERWLEAG